MLWHWLGARASLLFAWVLLLRDPFALVGSPFHPTALACAHLVVLGFLVPSVVGAFHLVGPLVLRTRARADWRDWTLLASIPLAASGVASHMALGTYSGVAWSGGLLLLALLLRVPSWWMELAMAPAPLVVRVGASWAWLGLLLAVCLGMALAVDRGAPFLPVGHYQALIGHAHLGVAGFALLMVVALGLRLLPMHLPAAPPPPLLAWLAVLATGVGAFGFGVTAPFVSDSGPWFAVVLALGVVAFLGCCARMVAVRKPRPLDLPRPDPAGMAIVFALLCLLAALGLGLSLAFDDTASPHAQLAYGVLALLGCLGSLVLGLGSRLLPLAGWHSAWHDRAPAAQPRPPRRAGSLPLQWIALLGWTAGVVLLTGAVLAGAQTAVRIAAWLLLCATLADTANVVVLWRRRHA